MSGPTEIKAGDHVLMMVNGEHWPTLMDTFALALRETFPGVEFTFVEGVTGALVMRPGDAHA